MTHIYTYTGRAVDPLAMTPDDVHILDIAHALSVNNRFTGHTDEPLSVAEHSVRLQGEMDDPKLRLWALLHDASEAYIADIASPLKRRREFEFYREIEARVMQVIAERFGLPWPMPNEVHRADKRMCATEIRDLMPGNVPVPPEVPYPCPVMPWGWRAAKQKFLDTFWRLM